MTQLYDHASIVSVQDGLLGGRVPRFYYAFRNPPFYALLHVPFAVLDLLPGFGVWCMVTLACLGLSIRLLASEVEWVKTRWGALLVFMFAFPPVYFGLIGGENPSCSSFFRSRSPSPRGGPRWCPTRSLRWR